MKQIDGVLRSGETNFGLCRRGWRRVGPGSQGGVQATPGDATIPSWRRVSLGTPGHG
jgi:hypothetical protein